MRSYPRMTKEDSYKEFIVKTYHVWVFVGFLFILCLSFFWLGRWYESYRERYRLPAHFEKGEKKWDASSFKREEDLEKMITFFDRLESEKRPHPREKDPDQSKLKRKEKTQKPPLSKSVTSHDGQRDIFYTIQISAGNRKEAALRDSKILSQKGFPSYVEEEVRASGILYKVRVGKFASRKEALDMESRLKRQGYKTWLLKID